MTWKDAGIKRFIYSNDFFYILFRFNIIGILCAVIFFFINFLARKITSETEFFPIIASYMVCVGIGYVMQRKFSFNYTYGYKKSLSRYLILQIIAGIFVYFSISWLQRNFELGQVSSSLTATGLAGIASFIASLTWVFRR